MRRSRLARALLFMAFAAAGAWLAVTVANAVRLGPRDSQPEVYWPAVALIAVVLAILLLGAGAVARRLRRG